MCCVASRKLLAASANLIVLHDLQLQLQRKLMRLQLVSWL